MLDFNNTPVEQLQEQIKRVLQEHSLLSQLERLSGPDPGARGNTRSQ